MKKIIVYKAARIIVSLAITGVTVAQYGGGAPWIIGS